MGRSKELGEALSLFFEKLRKLGHELVDVFKVSIYRSKTDIGYLVEAM